MIRSSKDQIRQVLMDVGKHPSIVGRVVRISHAFLPILDTTIVWCNFPTGKTLMAGVDHPAIGSISYQDGEWKLRIANAPLEAGEESCIVDFLT